MNLLISGDWFRSEHMIKANPSLPQDYSIKVGGNTVSLWKVAGSES